MQVLAEYLENLELKLNGKTQIFPFKNGINYLGFHTYVTNNGKVIRKLKELDVDVYFQNEQIWLKKERGEFNMAVHAAVAQEESMSKSRSIRWGLVYGFQSGMSKLANRICYGYEQDKDSMGY